MGKEINLLNLYPRTKRHIEERSLQVTEEHKVIAKKFSKEFFDGDRLFGYGGYNYNPRFWKATVERIKEYYKLPDNAKILDVGCAKGFMMNDFKEMMPKAEVLGIDISEYAYENSMINVKPYITVCSADDLPFPDGYFDLVISINTIHNLPIEKCKTALREIQRVTKKNAFITVDAWRNRNEYENMMKWNLTAQSFMDVREWINVFNECGYSGDYYWFIAE